MDIYSVSASLPGRICFLRLFHSTGIPSASIISKTSTLNQECVRHTNECPVCLILLHLSTLMWGILKCFQWVYPWKTPKNHNLRYAFWTCRLSLADALLALHINTMIRTWICTFCATPINLGERDCEL